MDDILQGILKCLCSKSMLHYGSIVSVLKPCPLALSPKVLILVPPGLYKCITVPCLCAIRVLLREIDLFIYFLVLESGGVCLCKANSVKLCV